MGFRVWGLGFGVWGLGFGVSRFGFRAWGLRKGLLLRLISRTLHEKQEQSRETSGSLCLGFRVSGSE